MAIGEMVLMAAMLIGIFTLSIAPVVLILGGTHFWFVHQGKKWGQAAAQLGLTLEPLEPRHRYGISRFFGKSQGPFYTQKMLGERAGLPVEVGVRIVVTGSGKNRRTSYYTNACVRFPKELGLGLKVVPRGMLDRAIGALVGESDLSIGDPEVDPHYTIHAADLAVAHAILTTPYVREALAGLRGVVFKPYIQDDSLRCEAHGKYFDARALALALDSAVDLARRLIAARQAAGPTHTEHAVNTAWRTVANARGFTLDLSNTKMHGRCEGVHVEVDTFLRKQSRWTLFTVRFERPLGVGLRLTRQGSLSAVGKFLGLQDIETGDALFDARFVVKGSPEAQVRALLTEEVRARLVELQSNATNLAVEDDRLAAEVGWLVADAAWLESGITAIARAGAALAQVTQREVGPYRQ